MHVACEQAFGRARWEEGKAKTLFFSPNREPVHRLVCMLYKQNKILAEAGQLK